MMKQFNAYDPVNIKLIDEQHYQINLCISELEKLSATGKKNIINLSIDELISRCIHHFITEENMMKKYKYENLFSHKYEHDRCIRKLKEYSSLYEESEMLDDLLFFINNWMKNHIDMKDKFFAEYLNNLKYS